MDKLMIENHSLSDGFTTSIRLANGNQKIIAEVRGGKYAEQLVISYNLHEELIGLLNDLLIWDAAGTQYRLNSNHAARIEAILHKEAAL